VVGVPGCCDTAKDFAVVAGVETTALAAGKAVLSKARVSLYIPLDDPADRAEAAAAEAAAALREEGEAGVHANGSLLEVTDD